MRLRIFVDFWNFQLNWRDRANGKRCDWSTLPLRLASAAQGVLTKGGLGAASLEETRVYASFEPGRETNLRDWLHNFVDRQPGIRVFVVERHWKRRSIHCRECHQDIEICPKCGAPVGRAAEKTVDAMIVTDLITLA